MPRLALHTVDAINAKNNPQSSQFTKVTIHNAIECNRL